MTDGLEPFPGRLLLYAINGWEVNTDSYESLATSLELRAYKATQVVIELAASDGINVHHVSGWVGQGDVRYITPRS